MSGLEACIREPSAYIGLTHLTQKNFMQNPMIHSCFRPSLGVVVTILLLVLTGTPQALASGAGFTLKSQGITLEPVKGSHHKYQGKVESGTPFKLVAQGMAYPRGGKPTPRKPESGGWTIDDKIFMKLTPDRKHSDKSMMAIRLDSTKLGTSKVSFNGKILGYTRSIEIEIEVVTAKQKPPGN
jgi:hypothetical protein